MIMFARNWAILAGAAAFAIGVSSIPVAEAQIVPETSAHPSAANSPAAAVQTGYRRRLDCPRCDASLLDRSSDHGASRMHSSRDPFPGEAATQLR